MTVPPGAIHTFKNASETEACEIYMSATPGHYVDCMFLSSNLTLILDLFVVNTAIIDFRMLAKAGKEGKMLNQDEIEHIMALFGTFPPDVESEP